MRYNIKVKGLQSPCPFIKETKINDCLEKTNLKESVEPLGGFIERVFLNAKEE